MSSGLPRMFIDTVVDLPPITLMQEPLRRKPTCLHRCLHNNHGCVYKHDFEQPYERKADPQQGTQGFGLSRRNLSMYPIWQRPLCSSGPFCSTRVSALATMDLSGLPLEPNRNTIPSLPLRSPCRSMATGLEPKGSVQMMQASVAANKGHKWQRIYHRDMDSKEPGNVTVAAGHLSSCKLTCNAMSA